MICPHCFIDMKPGIAIKENCPANCLCGPFSPWTWNELEMQACLKCPNCGHSEKENVR